MHNNDCSTGVKCGTCIEAKTADVKSGKNIDVYILGTQIDRLAHADGVVKEVPIGDLCAFGSSGCPGSVDNGPDIVIGEKG